jgi:hypothetical protein
LSATQPQTSISQENIIMKNRGIDIKHPKQRGEWAELRFIARAAEHGLCITKPWGEMSHYDFAIEHQGRFVRVQVKSTKYLRGRAYTCTVFTRSGPYGPNEIDFVAAYVIPLDIWYVIPGHVFEGQYHIHLSPHLKTSKFERYREAWHLLRGKPEKSRAAKAGR